MLASCRNSGLDHRRVLTGEGNAQPAAVEPSLREIYAACLREWMLTISVPADVNKREWLEAAALEQLTHAHKCHASSLKVHPVSAKTLCQWYSDTRSSGGRQRAERQICGIRGWLLNNFASGLALVPSTVDATLRLRPSESILAYIERLNHTRIRSQYLQSQIDRAAAGSALAQPQQPQTAVQQGAELRSQVLQTFYAPNSGSTRDSAFASGVVSFTTAVGSIEGTPPALTAASRLLLQGSAADIAAKAVSAATTTRKFHCVEDYHKAVEANALVSGLPLIYACDSKITKTKNFEAQLLFCYIPDEEGRGALCQGRCCART